MVNSFLGGPGRLGWPGCCDSPTSLRLARPALPLAGCAIPRAARLAARTFPPSPDPSLLMRTVRNPRPQMWVMTLRVMDDVKESVRRAAALTAR